jgi:translation initiation factor 2 beta subunit (eIF-2beta)/eIF-5
MTDEQIAKAFNQQSHYLITLRKKLEEKKTFEETDSFLAKYIRCPTCKSLIDKFEGYILKIVSSLKGEHVNSQSYN